MGVYGRAARGVEAGVVAAGAVELSFFLLDLIRLRPLATPFALSGAALGPAGVGLDLGGASGVAAALWATYQVIVLTFFHFVAFGLVGLLVSLLFDWTRPGGLGRFGIVAALCTLAFYLTVAWSGSALALESVGVPPVMGVNLLAAVVLGGSLRLVSMPDPEGERAEGGTEG